MGDRSEDFFKELELFCEKAHGEFSVQDDFASCRFYESAPLSILLIRLSPFEYGKNIYMYSPEAGEFDFNIHRDESGEIEIRSTAFEDGWVDSAEIHSSGGQIQGKLSVREILARKRGNEFVLKLL